jgi:Transmembrane secretion effector
VLTVADVTTPAVLLGATFVLGIRASLGLPAFSAVTVDLVDREQLPAAISLNSVSLTLSQAVSPALGGLLVAAIGAGGVFILNGVSFIAVAAVLFAWHRTPAVSSLPPEHVVSAMRVGLPLRRECARAAGRPAAARDPCPRLTRFHTGAAEFRTATRMPGRRRGTRCLAASSAPRAVGAGRRRDRLSADRRARRGDARRCAIAGTRLPHDGGAGLREHRNGLIVHDRGSERPARLDSRARRCGPGSLVPGGFALGAAAWGAIAVRVGVTEALAAAAVFIGAGSLLGLRIRLSSAEDLDVRAAHAQVPYPPVSLAADDGPIQLSVEYTVSSDDIAAFRAAASQLRGIRTRSGAMPGVL